MSPRLDSALASLGLLASPWVASPLTRRLRLSVAHCLSARAETTSKPNETPRALWPSPCEYTTSPCFAPPGRACLRRSNTEASESQRHRESFYLSPLLSMGRAIEGAARWWLRLGEGQRLIVKASRGKMRVFSAQHDWRRAIHLYDSGRKRKKRVTFTLQSHAGGEPKKPRSLPSGAERPSPKAPRLAFAATREPSGRAPAKNPLVRNPPFPLLA